MKKFNWKKFSKGLSLGFVGAIIGSIWWFGLLAAWLEDTAGWYCLFTFLIAIVEWHYVAWRKGR